MNRSRRRTEAAATEGYQGSVSDLMAGLVILFIIALAGFVLRVLQMEENVRRQVDAVLTTRDQILSDIQKRLEDRGLTVELIPDQGVLRLTEEQIEFAS